MVSMTSESRGDNPFLPRTVDILNISGGNISSINFLKSSVGFLFPLLMALASVVAGNITPIPFTNSTFCTFAWGIQYCYAYFTYVPFHGLVVEVAGQEMAMVMVVGEEMAVAEVVVEEAVVMVVGEEMAVAEVVGEEMAVVMVFGEKMAGQWLRSSGRRWQW